ncbi:MAG: hypothetical protein ABSG16_21295, partial [Candidatus Acidiferrum sp.]
VAALGGGLWRAGDQGVFSIGQGPAYEAWKNWRDTNDGPLTLVRAAILAASPHNTQPWLFKVTDSSIELYIDTQRNVGALDPYLREEHIGIGCAMENLILAARANGYAATVTIQPGQLEALPVDPQPPRLLARVDLAPGKREESALYEAIPRRHTNRGPYDPHKPIPSDFLETLGRLPGEDADAKLFLFTAEEDRKKIAELISAADTEIYSDPQVQRGSDRWVRMKWSSVEEHRDGLTIDAFGLSPVADAVVKMMTPGMLRLAGPHKEKNRYLNLMLSAPLLGFIAVRDRYEQEQCLRAGRIWQRAHLLATSRGLAARPCNEAVEMVDHERALGRPAFRATLLNDITGDSMWQATFAFYMGYATLPARASPRRPVQAMLV